jgi:hypothetical protein
MDFQSLFEALANFTEALALEFALGLGALPASLLGFFLALQFGEIAVDLCRAFVETSLRLRQFQSLHLRRMKSLLSILHRAPGGAELDLAVGQHLLCGTLHLTCRIFGGGSCSELPGKFVNLALALDHAMGLRIRHV